MAIHLKRAYDEVEKSDGYRILVDRLWPRGISKEQLQLYAWAKKIAPSNELRKWFKHDSKKFEDFTIRYKIELEKHSDYISRLKKKARDNDITLVYAAKDRTHNHAVVLKDFLLKDTDATV